MFVSHSGKMELSAVAGGTIRSTDYDSLIGQLSNQIDKNTKGKQRVRRGQIEGNEE